MDNKDEQNLGEFYGLLANPESKMHLPDNITREDLQNYINNMITAKQPRKIRIEGRKIPMIIDDYDIPINYHIIDSNSVSFHGSKGVIMMPEDEDEGEEEVTLNGTSIVLPNRWREDDMGAQLCLYIFKYGRKTLKELLEELKSYDKNMLTLLVNRMYYDKYLKLYTEEDGLETWELYTKDEKYPQKKLDKGVDSDVSHGV